MRQHERGEIATILMLGSLVVIAVTAVTSSFFVNKKQTTSSKAALACSADECAGSSTCVPVGSKSNGLECCKAGQNKAHPEYTWATWGTSCTAGDAHYGDNCCYIRTGTNAGGISGCTKAEDWNNFGTCTAGIPKCTTADEGNRKVCLEKAGTPPAGGGGEECPGKLNIQNKCDDACCETDAQCPSGQKCNIPNGNCKSGKSCNPSPWGLVIEKKIDGKCVKQPCMNQPCTDEAGCGTNAGGGGQTGVVCPPPSYGPQYKWADYGKTCICMNCVVSGSGCVADNKNPVTDPSLCCQKGQPGEGGTACGVYTDANCGKAGKLCCPESTGKPACEGTMSCDNGTCKTPEQKPAETPPDPNCVYMGGGCTYIACKASGGADYNCTTDNKWCCPPASRGSTNTNCTGQTAIKCSDPDKGYCKTNGGGGNNEFYFPVNSSYYSGSGCSDITQTIKTYCGCGGSGAPGEPVAECKGVKPADPCTHYCQTNGGGGNDRSIFLVSNEAYDEKCNPANKLPPDYCGCTGAKHSYSYTGKVTGSDAGKAVKASLTYAGEDGRINQGSLPATITGGSYSYNGTFGPEVKETTQCKVDILSSGNTVLGSTPAFTCLATAALPNVTLGSETLPPETSPAPGEGSPAPAAGTIQTNQPTEILFNAARLSGSVGSLTDFQTLGFYFNGTKYPVKVETPFSYFMTGLTANTEYAYMAYGSSNGVEKTGNSVTFKTATDPNSVANRCKSTLPCGITYPDTCGTTVMYDVPSAFTNTCSGWSWGYTWSGTRSFRVAAKDTAGNCVISCKKDGDPQGTFNGNCSSSDTCIPESTVGPRLDFSVYSSVAQSCFTKGYKLTAIGVQSTDAANTDGKSLNSIQQNVTQDFSIIPKEKKESYTFHGWLNYSDETGARLTVYSKDVVISSVEPPKTSMEIILTCN